MKLKSSFAAVVALAMGLGLFSQSVGAEETETVIPTDQQVEEAIQILIEKGLITIDPRTGEATIENDVLKLLGEQGRVKDEAGREGSVCGSGDPGGG